MKDKSEYPRFNVYWESYSYYTNGAPELQQKGFMTLDAAFAFATELKSQRKLVYGIFAGSAKPVIDRNWRKAWISRSRRSERRHR